MTHHFAMTSSLLIKILKIDKFGVFSSDIDLKLRWTYLGDDITLIIMLPPGDRRAPQADTKCPPAAQRKHAKRACPYY